MGQDQRETDRHQAESEMISEHFRREEELALSLHIDPLPIFLKGRRMSKHSHATVGAALDLVSDGVKLALVVPENLQGTTLKTFGEAGEDLLNFLERSQIHGSFQARAICKSRWKAEKVINLKVKMARPPQHGVIVTIRPESGDNGDVWEYLVDGVNWPPEQLFARFGEAVDKENHILKLERERSQQREAEKTAATTLGSTNGSLFDRIRDLEEKAGRNKARQRQLDDLGQEEQKLRDEIARLEKELAQIEKTQLKVLEQMDDDKECQEANQALDALRKLLG